MKNDFLLWYNSILLGLIIGMMLACSTVNKENNQLKQHNNHLKTELKVKDQQIKGLSEQVSRQTKRIAELTNNGG